MYFIGSRGISYQFDWSFLVLIGAFFFSLIVQISMQNTFTNFSKVAARNGMTGAQVAQMILQSEGLYNVQVRQVHGSLTDHYDPRTKTVNLSETVFNQRSLAAQGVAAHECGHAIQDARSYGPLRVRSTLVPIAGFGSRFSWILFIFGLLFSLPILINIGIILFSLALLFQLVTLPVEFNASKRALVKLSESGFMQQEELVGAKKVLGAAAMTYVASVATSLAALMRMLFLSRRR